MAEGAHVGAGAVVREGRVVGRGAVVGAGAVVVQDVPEGGAWSACRPPLAPWPERGAGPYLCQYVVGPDQPGGVRHWQHAQALVRDGHEVSIVTSYVLHQDRAVPDSARGRRIVRTPGSGPGRVAHLVDAGLRPRRALARPELCQLLGLGSPRRHARPPPGRGRGLVAAAQRGRSGSLVARARGARLLLEVRDLWRSAVATGLMTDHRAVAAIDRLARWCYARSDRIVALTRASPRASPPPGSIPPP